MAKSRWARWWKPSLETMFPAVSWIVLTAGMAVLLDRGPKDTSWDADNHFLTER